MKRTARTLQELCRAFLSNKKIRHSAAVRVQACWQRFRTQIYTESLKLHCVQIQAMARSHIGRRKVRFLRTAHASNELESTSVVKIQSWFRGLSSRLQYQDLRIRATMIQSLYRRFIVRVSYLMIHNSVLRLQARCRGHFVRKRVQVFFRSAQCVQKHWKACVARSLYKELRSAVELQARYLDATMAIQSWMRASLCQRKLKTLRVCATMVQSFFRSRTDRTRYLTMKRSVRTLQELCRTFLSNKKMLHLENAARRIQAYWLRFRTQLYAESLKLHSIQIQALARGHIARRKVRFLRTAHAVMRIQSWFRGLSSQLRYQDLRTRATMIQSFHRCCIVRAHYRMMRNSLLKLQARCRGHFVRKRVQLLSHSAQCIQKRWKASVARSLYKELRSAVELQASYLDATVTIQSWMRASLCQRKLKTFRVCATMVQSFFRSRMDRTRYLTTKRSVRTLQELCRTFLSNKKMLHLENAARRIQACWLRFRTRFYKESLKLHCVQVQAVARGHIARRKVGFLRRAHAKNKLKSTSVVRIQSWFRGLSSQLRYQDLRTKATMIQSFHRCCIVRAHYRMMRNSLLKLQARCRGHIVRKRVQLLSHSAQCIQKHWKASVALSFYKELRAAMELQARYVDAALAIQSWMRASLCQRKLKTLRVCATIVQSVFRSRMDRTRYLTMKRGVRTLQELCRAFLSNKKMQHCQNAALRVQACWLRFRAQLCTESLKLHCVQVQAVARGHIARRKVGFLRRARAKNKLESTSVVKIQSWFRGLSSQLQYQDLRTRAMMIQSFHRCCIVRAHYHMTRNNVLKLQAGCRGHFVRKHVQLLSHSAQCIQKHWKASVARSLYKELHLAAALVQAQIRGFLNRTRFKAVLRCSRQIQHCWRNYLSARHFTAMRHSAERVQSIARGFLARRLLVILDKKRLREASMNIQRSFRHHLVQIYLIKIHSAARIIEVAYLKWKLERQITKVVSCSALLERSLRGCLSHSARLFAVLQISMALDSPSAKAITRILIKFNSTAASRVHVWERARSDARQVVCVLIQSVVRGYQVRSVLKSNSNRGGQFLQSAGKVHWRRRRLSGCSPVAVKLLEQIDHHRVRVEFCPITYLRQYHAARLIQRFIRIIVLGQSRDTCHILRQAAHQDASFNNDDIPTREANCKNQVESQEYLLGHIFCESRSSHLHWANECLLRRAEGKANRFLSYLLDGKHLTIPYNIGSMGPCMNRLVTRIQESLVQSRHYGDPDFFEGTTPIQIVQDGCKWREAS